MKRLLLFFAVLVISVAANASIKFYDEEKKEITDDTNLGDAVYVALENLASNDFSGLSDARKTKLAQINKVVLIGQIQNDDEWTTVKGVLTAKEYDFSEYNADDFVNKKNNFGSKCQGTESVLTLPKTLNPIPEWLGNDIKPETLIIPNEITNIGTNAFYNCSSLKNVYIGNGVKNIGTHAFMNTSLENIFFTRGIHGCAFGDEVFKDCKQLKHANIPEGVQILGDGMFDGCLNLESVRIPSTVTRIGAKCFANCKSLTQITIPEAQGDPQRIGYEAFQNCDKLGDIYVMARTVDKIPLIIPVGQGMGGDGGTFANTLVNANGSEPPVDLINGTPTAEVPSLYSGKHCLNLHFPESETLRAFYDQNPYIDDDIVNDNSFNNRSIMTEAQAREAAKYLSNTYLVPDQNFVSRRTADNQYPAPNGDVWPLHEQSQSGPAYRIQRQTSDYERRNNAPYVIAARDGIELNNTNTYTNLGWIQLKIMSEYTPGVDVVERLVDDTWYTMCYPFNMTDEQLEDCFSAGYNIVEFSDARIVKMKEDPSKKAMVLYFTDIAKTYYMDEDNNLYYSDSSDKYVENNTDLRKYHRHNGTTDVTYQYRYSPNGAEELENTSKWYQIHGTLAFAGHPYMVHPNVGVVKGEKFVGTDKTMDRVKGYIAGVKQLTGDQYKPHTDPSVGQWTLKGDGYSNRSVAARAQDISADIPVQTQVKIQLMDCTENVENGTPTGGYMTFVGKVVPTEAADVDRGITQKIPMNAYFLGNKSDERYGENTNPIDANKKYYPRFYRRVNANATYNNWTQYTAVILPDKPAQAKLMSDVWDETDDGADVSLNDFGNIGNPGDVTSIQEVLQEAKEKNMPVEYMDVIFNIRGQEVKRGSTDLQNLPTGVYIVNGKKYFVK